MEVYNSFHKHTDNNKKCLLSRKSHIKMISEGSCDTEDWSNDWKCSFSSQE